MTADELIHCLQNDGELPESVEPKVLAEAIVYVNEKPDSLTTEQVHNLISVIEGKTDELLRAVCIGSIWREDLSWLDFKNAKGKEAREILLRWIAADKPEALSPGFWTAVADRGDYYIQLAFQATKNTYPLEAARLLVKLAKAGVEERVELNIRNTVDQFLANKESAVRSEFLDSVKKLHQKDKRALMTHLDMSLLAELDESAIEHRGKNFFYDENAEKMKRESKSKDIFSEVARRLEKGEKPS